MSEHPSIRSIITELEQSLYNVRSAHRVEVGYSTGKRDGKVEIFRYAIACLRTLEKRVAKTLFDQRELEHWASISRDGSEEEHWLKAEMLEAILGSAREVSGE